MATILCFSTVDWDYLWHRPQAVMSCLAADGHQVLYVDTIGLRSPGLRDAGRIAARVRRRIRSAGRGTYEPRPGVRVLAPVVLPLLNSRRARSANAWLLLRRIRRLLRDLRRGAQAVGDSAAGSAVVASGRATGESGNKGFGRHAAAGSAGAQGAGAQGASGQSAGGQSAQGQGAGAQGAGGQGASSQGTSGQGAGGQSADAQSADTLVIWVYLPTATVLECVQRLPHHVLVYEAIDALASNPAGVSEGYAEAEQSLLKRADLVLATSRALFEEKAAHNANTHWVPPGVSPVFLGSATSNSGVASNGGVASSGGVASTPPCMAHVPAPRIGFFGTIDHRLDLALVQQLAQTHPSWSFVLIGPARCDVRALDREPNVHLFGGMSQAELVPYLQALDVFFLPYVQDDFTCGIYPAKIFECLAVGKPVVATELPSLAELGDVVHLATDRPGFERGLAAALAEHDPALAAGRRDRARANSWEARCAQIRSLLVEVMG